LLCSFSIFMENTVLNQMATQNICAVHWYCKFPSRFHLWFTSLQKKFSCSEWRNQCRRANMVQKDFAAFWVCVIIRSSRPSHKYQQIWWIFSHDGHFPRHDQYTKSPKQWLKLTHAPKSFQVTTDYDVREIRLLFGSANRERDTPLSLNPWWRREACSKGPVRAVSPAGPETPMARCAPGRHLAPPHCPRLPGSSTRANTHRPLKTSPSLFRLAPTACVRASAMHSATQPPPAPS
jgi:hypothetical protein